MMHFLGSMHSCNFGSEHSHSDFGTMVLSEKWRWKLPEAGPISVEEATHQRQFSHLSISHSSFKESCVPFLHQAS